MCNINVIYNRNVTCVSKELSYIYFLSYRRIIIGVITKRLFYKQKKGEKVRDKVLKQ